jgi:protein-disulfide isomerase
VVNIALTFVAYVALRRSGSGALAGLREDLQAAAAAPRSVILLAAAILVVVLVAGAAIPPYWRIEPSTGPGGLTVGQTVGGHPWIGAAEPIVEIEEYSDYQCPHCRRGHDEVRKLILQYPDLVRLVHRHFPLDQQCNSAMKRAFHPYACHYAKLSFCAQQQDRFWEANDYLFSQGRRSLRVSVDELADDVDLDLDALRECMSDGRGVQAIQHDLASGRALHIRGTPTFVIGGEIFPGRVPPEVVTRALGLEQIGSSQVDPEPAQTP